LLSVVQWLLCGCKTPATELWEIPTLVLYDMQPIITEYPQYFTATILEWKKLLKPEKYKDIITGSMKFLVTDKRVKIFCFVIMDNHIHLIWQMLWDIDPEAVQRDFLKYTAQRIKKDLQQKSSGGFIKI
jgi:REP element-mobilizing transposase RayT